MKWLNMVLLLKQKAQYIPVSYTHLDVYKRQDYKVDPYVTIYALVNSIVENCAAGQVQILVNGETKVTYQSSVDLSQPFAADYDYVEKKD